MEIMAGTFRQIFGLFALSGMQTPKDNPPTSSAPKKIATVKSGKNIKARFGYSILVKDTPSVNS
jgi:hypothetical protein